MGSCVAVCTLDNEIVLPKEKIILQGTCKTENLGIENIVKTVIKNPEIRFLIICGEESSPRFAGSAIKSLWKNGMSEKGKIIGARGLMPFIKNLSPDEIEYFRKQVQIIDVVGEKDPAKIEAHIDSCNKKNPGHYNAPQPRGIEIRVILADYNPDSGWTADEKNDDNWFIIGVDRENRKIYAEHYVGYGENMRKCCKITGGTVESVMGTIVRLGKVTKLYHAAYLGKELQKAEIALKKGIKYSQELEFEI
ncbi:MAG: DUF4346 domain-containing protein [Candidatus Aenigmarchaeota archaeon]|nr:DUF4346 domain-containing protein [Candidatus Aenigmarchaeota archaeon]MDI6722596.1 DUF4346 domain-containing protein [Candidatus Aenigmarchaeota archaeon]